MKSVSKFFYKAVNKLFYLFTEMCSFVYLGIALNAINIQRGRLSIKGFPRFIVHKEGRVVIGDDFSMNSGKLHNPIGRNQRCILSVGKGAVLTIGRHVGMSSVAIVCEQSITIGDHVKIGGNTLIYDTDFHSLDATLRAQEPEDRKLVKRKPVTIGNHVFIGGHCIVLKGTIIGDRSIIGAGSVVSGIIPPDEIWGGNPARFIRNIHPVTLTTAE